MKVSATLNNLRIAPRKTKLVADLIKGMDVEDAIDQLETSVKRTNIPMKKLLLSAVANCENNFGLDKGNLYVYDVIISPGPSLKRWMPKAFGRAGKILKRTSGIKIVLEERIEGKGRKTKEQMEKLRKKQLEDKKKAEKERAEKEKEEGKTEKAKTPAEEKITEKKQENIQKSRSRKWGEKIFRRKSM